MRWALGLLGFVSLLLASRASRAQGCEEPLDGSDALRRRQWCAPELQTLAHEACAFAPAEASRSAKRTLILYLHGVVQPDTTTQWNQQRGAARIGAKYGYTVLMPRGRRGIGPTNMEDWWTWPTAIDTRKTHEEALLKEWAEAREALEKQAGAPFERVYLFAFSNGAYYATSLAMRGRLEIDGYALFAGGSGSPYHEIEAKKTKRRVPIAVSWGEGDPSHPKQVELAKMLKKMRWPFQAFGHRRAGHAMTDEEVSESLTFLGALR